MHHDWLSQWKIIAVVNLVRPALHFRAEWAKFSGCQSKISSYSLRAEVLSCMVFSVYEVVRVACLSHRKQTNYATDKPRERPRKTLKAMQERMNLCSHGKQLQFFFLLQYWHDVSRQRSQKMIDLYNFPEKIVDDQKRFPNKISLVQRKTNREKEETYKIRANKMIRGSLIKHDQVQK